MSKRAFDGKGEGTTLADLVTYGEVFDSAADAFRYSERTGAHRPLPVLDSRWLVVARSAS